MVFLTDFTNLNQFLPNILTLACIHFKKGTIGWPFKKKEIQNLFLFLVHLMKLKFVKNYHHLMHKNNQNIKCCLNQ